MKLLKRLFPKHFTDAQIEDKVKLRVREFIDDLMDRGIIEVNEGFTWKVECNQAKGLLRLYYSESASAVDNMLEENHVTTAMVDKEATQ